MLLPEHPAWIIYKMVDGASIKFEGVSHMLGDGFHQVNLVSSNLVCYISKTLWGKGGKHHLLKVRI